MVLPPDARGAARRRSTGWRVGIVEAPDWAEGMAASLRAGLAAVAARADAVVILLADMPEVGAAEIDRLIAAFDPGEGREIVRAVSADGTPGHPVLFGRRFFETAGAPHRRPRRARGAARGGGVRHRRPDPGPRRASPTSTPPRTGPPGARASGPRPPKAADLALASGLAAGASRVARPTARRRSGSMVAAAAQAIDDAAQALRGVRAVGRGMGGTVERRGPGNQAVELESGEPLEAGDIGGAVARLEQGAAPFAVADVDGSRR